MYVCLCKGITDSDIKQAVEDGATSFKEVRDSLGVATNCGSCACAAKKLVKSSAKYNQPSQTSLAYSVI